MTKRWYVVQTKAGAENVAAVNLANQDFPVFLPLRQISIYRKGKLEAVTRPLLPRYVFAQFDRGVDDWGVIRSTRGCIDVLKNGSSEEAKPSPVRDAVVKALRERDETPRPPPELGFTHGEEILIKVGPYADMEAIFVGEDKGMATIIVTLFGQAFTKEIATVDLARRLAQPLDSRRA